MTVYTRSVSENTVISEAPSRAFRKSADLTGPIVNEVINPKAGIDILGWIGYGRVLTSVITRKTDDGYHGGTTCAEANYTQAQSTDSGGVLSSSFAVPSGKDLLFLRAAVKIVSMGATSATIHLFAQFYDSSNAIVDTEPSRSCKVLRPLDYSTGKFHAIAGFIDIPSGAVTARVGIVLKKTESATFRVTNFQALFDPNSFPPFGDGDDSGWIWDSTPVPTLIDFTVNSNILSLAQWQTYGYDFASSNLRSQVLSSDDFISTSGVFSGVNQNIYRTDDYITAGTHTIKAHTTNTGVVHLAKDLVFSAGFRYPQTPNPDIQNTWDGLYAQVTGNKLYLRKIVYPGDGTSTITDLATAVNLTTSVASNTDYWVTFTKNGSAVSSKFYLSDPNVGSPSADTTLSATLGTSDNTKYAVKAQPVLIFTRFNSDEKLDDDRWIPTSMPANGSRSYRSNKLDYITSSTGYTTEASGTGSSVTSYTNGRLIGNVGTGGYIAVHSDWIPSFGGVEYTAQALDAPEVTIDWQDSAGATLTDDGINAKETVTKTAPLAASKMRLSIYVRAAGACDRTFQKFSIIDDSGKPQTRTFYVGFNDDSLLQARYSVATWQNHMRALGAQVYRSAISLQEFDANADGTAIDWTINPGKKYDDIYTHCNEVGVKYLALMTGCPASLRSGGSSAPPTSANYQKWADLVGQFVTRWPSAFAFEIWNEPNLAGNWASPSGTDYGNLLKKAYDTVKTKNANMKCSTAGIAMGIGTDGTNISSWTFLNDMYTAAGASKFDAISIHCYPGNAGSDAFPSDTDPPTQNQNFDTDLHLAEQIRHNKSDDSKPLWVTEFGSTTTGTAARNVLTESQQKRANRHMTQLLRRRSSIQVSLCHTLENENAGASETGFGLVEKTTFRKKPAYTGMMTEWNGPGTLNETLPILTDSYTRRVLFARQPTQSLPLSDSPNRLGRYSRSQSQTTSTSNSSSKLVRWGRSASNTFPAISDQESVNRIWRRSANQSLSFSDSISRRTTDSRTSSNSLSLANALSKLVRFGRNISDSLPAISNQDNVNRFWQRALSQSLSFSDSISRRTSMEFRTISNSLIVADLLSRTQIRTTGISNSLPILTNQLALHIAVSRTLPQALSLSQSVNRTLVRVRLTFESIPLSAALTRGEHISRTVSNALSLSNQLNYRFKGQVFVFESLPLHESTARTTRAYRTQSEALSLASSLYASKNRFRGVSDATLISDLLLRDVAYGRLISNHAPIVSSVNRIFQRAVFLFEAIPLSQAQSQHRSFKRADIESIPADDIFDRHFLIIRNRLEHLPLTNSLTSRPHYYRLISQSLPALSTLLVAHIAYFREIPQDISSLLQILLEIPYSKADMGIENLPATNNQLILHNTNVNQASESLIMPDDEFVPHLIEKEVALREEESFADLIFVGEEELVVREIGTGNFPDDVMLILQRPVHMVEVLDDTTNLIARTR